MGKRGRTGEHLKGRFGASSNGFRTGRVVSHGYVLVLTDLNHPMRVMRNSVGYIPEHRLAMAKHLGRPLSRDELVHHINGNKADNRIDNLELTDRKSHPSKHAKRDMFQQIQCTACGKLFIPKRRPRTKRPCCSRQCGFTLSRNRIKKENNFVY